MAPSAASITAAKTSAKRAGFDSLDEAMLAAGLTRRGGSTRHPLDLQQGELSALIDDLRDGRLVPVVVAPAVAPAADAHVVSGPVTLGRAAAMLGHQVAVVPMGKSISTAITGVAGAVRRSPTTGKLVLRIEDGDGQRLTAYALEHLVWSRIDD